MINNNLNLALPFSIYGFGNCGKKIATRLRNKGYQVEYFIDMRAEVNQKIDGIACIRPELCSTHGVTQVIIGVFNRDVSPKIIKKILFDNNVKTVVSFHEINQYIPEIVESSFWYDPTLNLKNYEFKTNSALALFKEDESRLTFEQILKFRTTHKIEDHLEGIGIDKQYFDVTIPNWLVTDAITMLDCGAYDGDTIEASIKYKAPVKTAYCFEPDQANYFKLTQYCKDKHDIRFHLIPCATWSSSTQLFFQNDFGEGSFISESTGVSIQALAIDDFLVNTPFNFLKIDVEGADLDTLKGAITNIKKHRPFIAIAIYHRPTDLWDIPLFLAENTNDYSFHLRQHGHNCFDTVLYGIPN